ncbi:RiPP maturation radical SAM C-methyltransferase [Dictyobacter formicarum]|uniref:RiPP maturation radical SAM protein 1 n=1 Tax=Dictyobacter formicarum TaxID=2778368 RepID=A0ABQ3VT04_9CHLR|nr:RiPP maturation radical SAM C-methyltransferase [Dictyobacter formicarum]GHO88866.1 RiPP maturation radical SAM protein 1 [Dictyobacter formicarum]
MDMRQQTAGMLEQQDLQKPVDVILVSMPFGPLRQPSMGLSLLKATLNPDHIATKILYFTLPFAKLIGPALYEYIAAGHPNTTDLVGEWIFSATLFDSSDCHSQAYIEQILRQEARMYQELFGKRVRAADELVDDVLMARTQAEDFLAACVQEVLAYKPRMVGFTSVFQQHVASLALAQRLKERLPDLCVVFGGANCEGVMGAELIRQFPFIDAVVSGEGEQVFSALVERCLAGARFDNLPGVYTRRNLSFLSANSRYSNAPSVRDMDALPFPQFDDFFTQWEAVALDTGLPKLLFETSRGCWWGEKHHCTFCGLNGQTMSFRSKSARRAIDEIVHLTSAYPHSSIAVVDNILDMKYFKEFLPELATRQLGLELFYEVKANLRKDQLQLLRDAGVRQIQPGIESLSSQVLEIMNKGVKGLQNIQLLKWCKELGIIPHWSIIWGFPGEPPEEYARMAELIPLLSHLTPPIMAGTIRLDRFSPNYDNAEQLGFLDVTPYPAYGYIYPFSEQSLANLAYFFTYRYEDDRDIISYARPIHERVLEWQDTHAQSELFSINKDTHLLIRDRRPIAQRPLVILSGLQRVLYCACDGIRSLGQLYQVAKDHLEPEELSCRQVEDALQSLVEQQLMIREGDLFLGLAIPYSVSNQDL